MSRAGSLLLSEGIITQSQLEEATRYQSLNGGTIGLCLVQRGYVSEDVLVSFFCSSLNLDKIDFSELETTTLEIASLIPMGLAVSARVIPIHNYNNGFLSVAMSDPTDIGTIEEIGRTTENKIIIKVAHESHMTLTLERLYGKSSGVRSSTKEVITIHNISIDSQTKGDQERGSANKNKAVFGITEEIKYRLSKLDPLDGKWEPLSLKSHHKKATEDKKNTHPRDQQQAKYRPPLPQKLISNHPSPSSKSVKKKDTIKFRSDKDPTSLKTSQRILPKPIDSTDLYEVEAEQKNHTTLDSELIHEIFKDDDSQNTLIPRDTLLDTLYIDMNQNGAEITTEEPEKAIELIKNASSRDEAIQGALTYMTSKCRRAAFFIIKRGAIEGYDALGVHMTINQIRNIWLSLASPSSLREAVTQRSTQIGPLGDTRTDAVFCASLGGRRGDSILVPIIIAQRVVALLYGDDIKGVSLKKNEIEQIGTALSTALTQFLVKEKKKNKG